ncbi:MAG: hypothetical protein WC449_04955 [Candidatus Paceibacterota bacterium]
MKWESEENAEKVLNKNELVLCFIEFYVGPHADVITDFDICEYDGFYFLPQNIEKTSDCNYYVVTHFMIIEEPTDENTNTTP